MTAEISSLPNQFSYAAVLREAIEAVEAHSTCPSEGKPRFVAAARETVAALLGLAAHLEQLGSSGYMTSLEVAIACVEPHETTIAADASAWKPSLYLQALRLLISELAAGFDPPRDGATATRNGD